MLQKQGSAVPSYSYDVLDPGLTYRKTVFLSRGDWTLHCSLEGHRAAGMERTLVVE